MVTEPTLFELDAAEGWQPIYRRFDGEAPARPGHLCRDCGRTSFTWLHGCGGSRGLGWYDLCDDCAALDGRGQRRDGSTDSSRWGIRTTDEEAARLTELQSARRANRMRANR